MTDASKPGPSISVRTRKWRGLRFVGLGILVAAMNLIAVFWEDLFPSPRYVLIHSDDAGLCRSVNQATIDFHGERCCQLGEHSRELPRLRRDR